MGIERTSPEPSRDGVVLVVDDTPVNINVLFETLERRGYKVLVASNGETALERARLGSPDVILLDVMMPGIDGFETCRRLKADDRTRDIPVVFMTALAETVDKLKGFELGAVDYITKPFYSEEVGARVDTHITLRRLRQELERHNVELEEIVEERTRELKRAKERAERADRLKTEFLMQMSHEVRTPINTMISFAGLLDMQTEDMQTEELRESIGAIENGGKRLARTFDLIMAMAQLQSSSHEYRPERFDLRTVLGPVVDRYRKEAERRGIELEYRVESDDLSMEGDADMIATALENVVDNAVRFTREGKVEITLRREGDRVRFESRDTGVGISENFIPSLYEPFTQEEQGFSRPFEGTGLGLPLAKRYLDIHNADIDVESVKGDGTVFSILFAENAPDENQARQNAVESV
ncbi:MAG: response regulator [Ignavibacteriales bacterium]|nr:response regulator [Ignavibacteriales bacterium]